MIDLIQWRVCIGMWCCRIKPVKRKSTLLNNMQSHPGVKDYHHREKETLAVCMNILRILLSHTSVCLYTLTVCIFLQLVLSGDVESNPGPVEITPGNAVILLNDCGFNFKTSWNRLSSILNVPVEVKEKMRAIIKEDETYEYAIELALDWWIKNTSEASWKELISSVNKCGEKDTADVMKKILSDEASTSGKPQSQFFCEPNQLTPFHILKKHYSEILDVVCDPNKLANDLWAANLISNVVKDNIISTPSVPRYEKASKLLDEVQRSLRVNENPEALIFLCKALTNQKNSVMSMICKTMMKELGVSLDVMSFEVTTDSEKFVEGLCDRYIQNPVVYNELLDQRVCRNNFGQLGLIKGHGGCLSEPKGRNRSWNMLRGKLDNIMNVSEKIDIQDVLKHDCNSPIKVVVDGPPGVGKTTLCQKLCNMWAKNELNTFSFDLVFLVSLRDEEVSSAEKIYDLVSLFHSCEEVCETISKTIKQTNGENMLLIFDGWDEFKGRDKNRSFILDVIEGRQLHKCNVLVTSRTYASAKLLQLQSINRHVEVLGFEEEEIYSCIKTRLTEENAEQLIKELKIREDVLSLCYIPFVCSMLVRVYQLSGFILPNTLTKFYKKYILYAVKTSMKKQALDPDTVESLEDLEEDQKQAFDELCCCAYEKLETQINTFNRNEILKLSHSFKYGHFGLMNCYKIADSTKYQFLHLTIQEFLAAWWITHHNDQKVLFRKHFHETHFCMVLRFVAGLTELKDDSYQNYFSKKIDLQCIRDPMFGFESHQYSMIHRNPQLLCDEIRNSVLSEYPLHEPYYDTNAIQLLHLIYESENPVLCQIFVSSIIDSSFCAYRVNSSQFDLLCLSFLLKNSKITWNYLHIEYVHDLQQLCNEDSNMTKCIVMKAMFYDITSVIKIHQSSLCHYLQESYIKLFYTSNTIHLNSAVIMLSKLFKLPHLSILHVEIQMFSFFESEEYIDNELLIEMKKVLSANQTIKEFLIKTNLKFNSLINSLLTGVERNDTIQFFSLSSENSQIKSLQIEELLKNNQTLQAVKLHTNIKGILPSLCIIPANESLTALNITDNHALTPLENDALHDIIVYPIKKTETLSPELENVGRNITNLKSLCLYKPLIPLNIYFDSNPFIQHLDIVLEREESLEELFNILSSNTDIISLRIKCKDIGKFHDKIGNSLQLMLSLNKSLQCLEIKSRASNCTLLMTYLTTGLRGNNTLQELNVKIMLSENISFKDFFEATYYLKSLTLLFYGLHVLTSLYYEEIIPHVTSMLKRNEDMKFLEVILFQSKDTPEDDWIPMIHQFCETVLLHPSLCYVRISKSSFVTDILNDMKKTLITQRKKKKLGPHPIVEMTRM